MILKYSDLKGRTDLVGRKVRAVPGKNNPCSELQDDGSNTAVIASINNFTVFIDDCDHIFSDKYYLELLDEEPATDTRTEITWENATMDSIIISSSGIIDTLRNWAQPRAKLEGWYLEGSKDEPIKMTLSQIEEKLGHKVKIVE